ASVTTPHPDARSGRSNSAIGRGKHGTGHSLGPVACALNDVRSLIVRWARRHSVGSPTCPSLSFMTHPPGFVKSLFPLPAREELIPCGKLAHLVPPHAQLQ